MSVIYTIQGFNLNQPEQGFKLMEGTSYAPPISPRRVNLEIPRMHGQIPMWDDELPSAKLTLRVRISGDTPTILENRWQHLRALMWTGSNTGLTIRREINGHLHYCFAQLENMTEPDFWCAAGIVDTTMLLNIPSGRWESVQVYEEAFPTQLSTGFSLGFVSQSTAPVTDALIRYQGPYSSDGAWTEFYDDTTQTGFRISPGQTLSSSQYIIVDLGQFRAWINDTNDWNARQVEITPGLRPLLRGILSLVSVPSFQINVRTNASRTMRSASANTTIGTIRGRRSFI